MRSTIISTVLMVLALSSHTLIADVSVNMRPNPLFVGETGYYEIISSDGKPQLRSFPKVDGITWHANAPSTSIQIMNFNRTDKLTYRFTATKAGKFVIPETRIQVGNRVFTTGKQEIVVKERQFSDQGNSVTLDELVFLKVAYNYLSDPPEKLYLGQELTVNIKLYIDERLQLFSDRFNQGQSFTNPNNYFPTVELDNVVFRDYSEHNKFNPKFLYKDAVTEMVNGRRYQVFFYQTSISGIEVGTIEGHIEHTLPLVDPNRQDRRSTRRRSPFDDFFDGNFPGFGSQKQIITHRVEAVVSPISVMAVPVDEGRNGHYLGLIGSWKIDLSLDSNQAAVGDDVTVIMKLEGTGNITALAAPELELPGFRVYPPEVTRESGKISKGTVKWVVIPLNSESQFPQLKFKTFDSDSGHYKHHEFQPVLTVKRSENRTESGPIFEDYSINVQPQRKTEREIRRSTDILYIKKSISNYVTLPLWRNVSIPVGIAGITGPILYIAVVLLALRREKLQGSASFRRRREALKNRKKIFRSIAKSKPDELPGIVRDTLNPYLLAMLDLPPGSTSPELFEKIDDKDLVEMLKQVELDGFMPGNSTQIEARDLLKRIKKLVLVTLCFIAPFVSNANELFDQATIAYDQGMLDDSEAIYRGLQKKDLGNSALLFNLGNCAYRKGDYGRAIYYYERARRLAPRDSDIVENLNFVRGQLNLPVVNPRDTPGAVLTSFRDQLRADEWLVCAGILWLSFWVFTANSRWRGVSNHLVQSIVVALFCITLIAYYSQVHSFYGANQAVVIAANTPIYRLPAQSVEEKAKLVLKAGEYVSIEERRTDWTRVRIDQAEGWVKSTAIKEYW